MSFEPGAIKQEPGTEVELRSEIDPDQPPPYHAHTRGLPPPRPGSFGKERYIQFLDLFAANALIIYGYQDHGLRVGVAECIDVLRGCRDSVVDTWAEGYPQHRGRFEPFYQRARLLGLTFRQLGTMQYILRARDCLITEEDLKFFSTIVEVTEPIPLGPVPPICIHPVTHPRRSITQIFADDVALQLQEENFHARPSVRITVPDHLKNLLVDDWENVTKSLLLVPLPSQAPANFILDCYFHDEKNNRRIGSPEADILEEFVAGLKVYFDKALGKILLYRFERNQLGEIRKLWESGKYPAWEDKGPGDCYGAEHLCRMIVNLPEMIAQTNMDAQSVARLKEEITKLCNWLARNSARFFCLKYEKPTAEYVENAR